MRTTPPPPAPRLDDRGTGALEGEDQYTLGQILGIWAAAALPMAALAWGGTAIVGDRLDLGVGEANRAVFTRAIFITLGLSWQFVLVLVLIKREEGDLRWATTA